MDKLILKVGKALTPTEELNEVSLIIEDGKVKRIASWNSGENKNTHIFPEAIACPGFIDIHMHGYGGYDSTTDKSKNLRKIAETIPETGVTTFLPTTMSETQEALMKAAEAFREAKRRNNEGAEMPGIHFEGPHFGTGEEKGAQNPEVLRKPDLDELDDLYETADGMIDRITLAPELPEAKKYIEKAKELEIVLSAGHTAASYEEALEGFEAGITISNHLYNGMKSFHHRKPGIIGATLTRDNVYAELIADLVHLHPATIDITLRSKGVEKTILITDSISVTGLSDGRYELGGQEIIVENGISKIKETGRLAGSTLTMNKAIKNVYSKLEYDIKDVVRMATLNPATALGYPDRGRLSPGCAGNVTIIDSEFNVLATIVNGKVLYKCS